ncbi:hypothetical protein [Natrialba aegyptia]|uniref:AlkP-core domain protein n=1 Tax=Natrialba aegyptia DSM 13077 TaxID=1227491 RepID=M0B104_9EURY|nr:hypothetical protein C480_13666 [Natrialba aegyptia DSM 13077]
MDSSFTTWLRDHRTQILSDPLRGSMHAAFTFYLGLWYTITSRWQLGTHVYDEDWDMLVILDACRVDVLEAVAEDYEFIDTVDSRWSIGSHSHEWLTKTFTADRAAEIAETAYISGNGHTHETFVTADYPPDETVPFCWPDWDTVDREAFGHLDLLWESAHQDELGVPPRAVTDRTVELARQDDYDRVIAHYMQPHIPYIADALSEERMPTDTEANGWKSLESDEADHDEVWAQYEKNLRLVLDEVEVLLENADAERVIITADHGNAFGEYSVYGHPEGFLLPCVKQVPWVSTTATDEETFVPDGAYRSEESTDIEDHLQDLGYL